VISPPEFNLLQSDRPTHPGNSLAARCHLALVTSNF
jgi:hypothetical protein